MKRIEAIEEIMRDVTDEIVVTSCGKISREVFATKDRPLNFYVMGSMGSTLPIAIGISLCKPSKKVVVIVGDGEVLMSLGTLTLLNKLQKEQKINNLILYILDNNSYSSTGGQKTVSDAVEFRLLCDCKVIFVEEGNSDVPRISLKPVQIKERFMEAIREERK